MKILSAGITQPFCVNYILTFLFEFIDSQGPKVQQKTKEQKMQAALAGGKAKKKKWNKGKMREKINAKVLFDEDGWNRLQAEVPKVRYSHHSLT